MGDDSQCIAYLARARFEGDSAHRLGALVVDQRGIPREFRCTAPVRPNAIQTLLYGGTLQRHMLVTVMGAPLVNQLKERYSLLATSEPELLGLRGRLDCPVVWLRRQGEASALGKGLVAADAESLIPHPGGRFEAAVMECAHGFSEDQSTAHQILTAAAANMDVLEPFERVQRALAKVHEEKALEER